MLHHNRVILKNPVHLHHPADSPQLPGQAETPQCWCVRLNRPSAGRSCGPERTQKSHGCRKKQNLEHITWVIV